MSELRNIAISASAGSGKTYTLTNRFIYLLHLCEKPERIIALTFTRTAAGEFFQKIIEKLCSAASDTDKAKQLSGKLSIHADSARYQELLKLLIESMHKLNLQTLDSFFFRIVSCFALELGLSGNLNLLNETTEARVRNEVRDHIVHHPGELGAELNEFCHAFKQATYGQEARSIQSTVSNFIESLYILYLNSPDEALWGNPDTIWPEGCQWHSRSDPDWDLLAEDLITSLPEGLSKSQLADFQTAATKVRTYGQDEKTNTLLNRTLAQANEIFNGSTLLQCGRGTNNKVQLSQSTCNALAGILKALTWHHLHRALQNTQGVYRILKAYHKNYNRLVRRPGRLAFADLTHLLTPDSKGSPMASMDDMARELMDFRLDGQYDHWLFDEFQDTSRPQWQVVANLIDEVIQDTSGERSLFYVGDTKQCLYLWRNSDDRLFHDILKHYPGIEEQHLATSWRSAPAILDAVNKVFESPQLIEETFGTDAAARWARGWKEHTASSATENQNGYACWLQAQKNKSPTRNELILKILTEINPIGCGMNVGILVRKNSDANEIADYLNRYSTIPVHTGSAVKPAEDNSAGAALLAMLRLAAHPGDAHARGFLSLIDASTPGNSLVKGTTEFRNRLFRDSHESAVRWVVAQITQHLSENDTRHRQRLEQLVEKARAFDSEDRRDIDGLYNYLKNSSSGECTSEAVIVETIHKSKGLEYDIVILICEDKANRIGQHISPLLNTDGKAEWILEPIKKKYMEADPELTRLHAQNESQQGFDRLCTLYVGMTRAKQALYMISDLSRASRHSTVYFLREQLELGDLSDENDILWETGDPNWFLEFKGQETEDRNVERPLITSPKFEPAHSRLHLARPSSDKVMMLKADRLFDLEATARDFGTAVHRAFEQIEWLENENVSKLRDSLRAERCLANGALTPSEKVLETIEDCFKNSHIRKLFTRPNTPCRLWREKAFSRVEGDELTNGVFDRVHLCIDTDNNFTSAEIIDFKTDHIHEHNTIEQLIERHRPQLEHYRHALSGSLDLSENLIATTLLFTDRPTLIRL